jgi:hypothetical protein
MEKKFPPKEEINDSQMDKLCDIWNSWNIKIETLMMLENLKEIIMEKESKFELEN